MVEPEEKRGKIRTVDSMCCASFPAVLITLQTIRSCLKSVQLVKNESSRVRQFFLDHPFACLNVLIKGKLF